MPGHLRRSDRRLLFVVGDGLSAAAAVTLAQWTWSLTAGFPLTPQFIVQHAQWFLAVPIWMAALAPSRRASAAFHARSAAVGLIQAAGALFVAYLLAFFAFGPDRLPRLLAVYVLWNATWLTIAVRTVLVWRLTRGAFVRRVAIVGEGSGADAAARLLKDPAFAGAELAAPPALTLPTVLDGLTDVIVAGASALPTGTVDGLLHCQARGIEVTTYTSLHEELLMRVPVRFVGDEWVLTQLFAGDEGRGTSSIAKRTLDVCGATVLAVLGLLPAMLAALAVLLESGFPIFYSQQRSGRGARTFRLTKFRTMKKDAEADGPQWSPENDPRITPVGRVLRRTHIDELPNLLAVFRGDMSLVGPRPERPEFLELLERELPLYRSRLTVAPGLTGWAQVMTEYGDSVDDSARKLEYDLYYVRHQSLWFDVTILFRTVGRMLGWKGR